MYDNYGMERENERIRMEGTQAWGCLFSVLVDSSREKLSRYKWSINKNQGCIFSRFLVNPFSRVPIEHIKVKSNLDFGYK